MFCPLLLEVIWRILLLNLLMALSNIIAAIVALFFYYQGGWTKQVIREYKESVQPAPSPFAPEEG